MGLRLNGVVLNIFLTYVIVLIIQKEAVCVMLVTCDVVITTAHKTIQKSSSENNNNLFFVFKLFLISNHYFTLLEFKYFCPCQTCVTSDAVQINLPCLVEKKKNIQYLPLTSYKKTKIKPELSFLFVRDTSAPKDYEK